MQTIGEDKIIQFKSGSTFISTFATKLNAGTSLDPNIYKLFSCEHKKYLLLLGLIARYQTAFEAY